MASAAPVSLRITRQDRAWLTCALVLGVAVALSLAVWIASQLEASLAITAFMAVLSALAAGAWILRRWRHPVGQLSWTGSVWTWQAADPAGAPAQPERIGHPEVAIDLGNWLLLRWHALEGNLLAPSLHQWLPVGRADAPEAWHGLRVALHAPAVNDPPPPDDRGEHEP